FFTLLRPPPLSTLFPYTTLFRSLVGLATFLVGKRMRNSAPTVRFNRISFERGMVVMARFAPDGNSVIYDAGWEGNPIRGKPCHRSEEHTSELQSQSNLVCRLLLE